MEKLVSVGKILNFHGIQGEAKVGYSKNQESFLESLSTVFVQKSGKFEELRIKGIRFHKGTAIVKFEGINEINDLLPFKGCLIFVENKFIRENLEENEFLIDELTGLDVFDTEGNKLGFVIGVSNNGASDLLSIKSKSKKISLVPFVDELVPTVDIKNKKIIVNNIKGLIE